MEKVRPWCGQPSDRGRLRNRTEQNHALLILVVLMLSNDRYVALIFSVFSL